MRSPCRSLVLVVGLAAPIALLLGGCGPNKQERAAMKRRLEDKARAEAAKKVVHAESEKIIREAQQKKDPNRDQGAGEGALTFGDKTLTFSEVTILLPAAGSPGPASLRCSTAKGGALTIPAVTLENAPDKPGKIAGQSFDLNDSNNAGAEITAEDGSKWSIKSAGVMFTRADRNLVIISIEGTVVDATGAQADRVKMSGEIQARVKDANGNFVNEETKPTTP